MKVKQFLFMPASEKFFLAIPLSFSPPHHQALFSILHFAHPSANLGNIRALNPRITSVGLGSPIPEDFLRVAREVGELHFGFVHNTHPLILTKSSSTSSTNMFLHHPPPLRFLPSPQSERDRKG